MCFLSAKSHLFLRFMANMLRAANAAVLRSANVIALNEVVVTSGIVNEGVEGDDHEGEAKVGDFLILTILSSAHRDDQAGKSASFNGIVSRIMSGVVTLYDI